MTYKEAMEHCLFRFISGSHAYGMNTAESDEDHRGVFMAPIGKSFDLFQTSFVGSGTIGQHLKSAIEAIDSGRSDVAREHVRIALEPDNGDLMTTIGTVHSEESDEELHELRKFFKLAAESNPNIIEYLYVDRLITHSTPAWEKIRANRHMFLSKKTRWTFAEYAIAQMNRIKMHRGYLLNPPNGKPQRHDYGLSDEPEIPKEYYGGLLSVPNSMVTSGLQEIVRKELAYREALNRWRAYENWRKHRNQKRAEMEAKFGLDTKHASHLVRLARMGKEILSTGQVIIYRPDREELMAIRKGAWSYEKVEEFAKNINSGLDELYAKSPLRDRPDYDGIASLYKEVCEDAYGIKLR